MINGLAAATTNVELGANLDAGQTPFAGAYAAGDMAAFNATGGVSRRAAAHGRARCRCTIRSAARTISMSRSSRMRPRTPGTSRVYADPAEVEAASHPNGLLASGTVTFNGDGTLASTNITPNYPAAVAGGAGRDRLARRQRAERQLDHARSRHGRRRRRPQPVRERLQRRVRDPERRRGRRAERRQIDQEGYVIASFTNGATQKIYKLPIATFANPLALDPRTGNVYAQTAASGEFNLRDAGRGGAGTIAPSALESANVDLAEEFTKMIVTQRAYSANARVITTTDEMLDELIRISR